MSASVIHHSDDSGKSGSRQLVVRLAFGILAILPFVAVAALVLLS